MDYNKIEFTASLKTYFDHIQINGSEKNDICT